MFDSDAPMKIVISRLKEREKELNCIYQVEQALADTGIDLESALTRLLNIIPMGWQYPSVCEVRIIYESIRVQTENFYETEWMQKADLLIDNSISGSITISYTTLVRMLHGSQFLPEEQKLLQLIADRVSSNLFYRQLKSSIEFLKATAEGQNIPGEIYHLLKNSSDVHWKWRLRMALIIAEKTDLKKFGIRAMYLIGSAKEATAGPGSDLDLLIHFEGNKSQKELMKVWMDGWSFALAEFNYAQTGYRVEEMIDLHIITHESFRKKDSFASMVTDPLRPAMLLKGDRADP